MADIQIIDTTLRDGAQSLWANRLSTGMMLAVIEHLDRAGFESMEFGYGPGVRAVQELDEDPSAWLRLGAPKAKRTPLRWIGAVGGQHAGRKVEKTPSCVQELRCRMFLEQGISITRASDPWNNYERLGEQVRTTQALGMRTIANLIYTISPRHTDEYFIEKAKEAASTRPYRVCFKDVGGILTPERARDLVPELLKAIGDVPLEFHGHCSTGMGTACVVTVAECGVKYIHTGVPPLAEGNAQPSVFSAIENLRELGFDVAIDPEPLRQASAILYEIARRSRYPVGAPVALDIRQYRHQIPGGMIANLAFQLKQVGHEEKLSDALTEVARVRAELGYPIMVTPLSQFVGAQALINVITGKRYVSVSDEIIRYAQGYYGEEAISVMDSGLREAVLNSRRAEQLVDDDGDAEESLEEVRLRYGDVTLEELPYVISYGVKSLALLRRGKEVLPYRTAVSASGARWLSRFIEECMPGETMEVRDGDMWLRVGMKART